MRTKTFLTPMTPDGKPGELVAVQYNDEGTRQFAPPVNPYLVNEKTLGDLRTAVTDAETALRHGKSRRAGASEISRLEKALTTAKRELDTVEYELRRNRQRQQVGGNDVFERREVRQTLTELVASAAACVAALKPPQAKHTMACSASPRCKPQAGPGRYKCARCRAAAAA